ncbi:MAG: FHA domain-containing protein [Candidatus Aminicenantes bacterium]|nr:FHA domain-containing protein [Candidatus Aminicenantes bacterium]
MPPLPEPITRDFSFYEFGPGYFPFGGVPAGALGNLAVIYFHTHEALELADLLNIPYDYNPPLYVIAFSGPGYGAGWDGTRTNHPRSWPKAMIKIKNETSLYGDPGRPDNREWHEFGHHLTAEAFENAFPYLPGKKNHHGYYVNRQSTDAWTEGLAEFLSTMIAKHIAGYPFPHFYHMAWPGFFVDLELDYRAWRPYGLGEELAVAGLLLDLEDGPADYGPRPENTARFLLRHGVVEADGQKALVGRVQNMGQEDAVSVAVYAAFYDGAGNVVHQVAAFSDPRDLRGTMPSRFGDRPLKRGEIGTFGMSLAEAPAFDRYEVAVREVVGGRTGVDDDLIDLTLEEVWETILRHRSTERRYGNYRTFDVKDLYDAFKAKVGGRDADRNGIDDLDEIFIKHGFFADRNGDRVWQPGEEVGMSDHPSRLGSPEMIPRRNTPEQPGAFIGFEGRREGRPAEIDRFIVETRFPKETGRARLNRSAVVRVPREKKGRLYVIMPPEEYGAKAVITPLDAAGQPGQSLILDSKDYWRAMDARPKDDFMRHEFVLPKEKPPAKRGEEEEELAGREADRIRPPDWRPGAAGGGGGGGGGGSPGARKADLTGLDMRSEDAGLERPSEEPVAPGPVAPKPDPSAPDPSGGIIRPPVGPGPGGEAGGGARGATAQPPTLAGGGGAAGTGSGGGGGGFVVPGGRGPSSLLFLGAGLFILASAVLVLAIIRVSRAKAARSLDRDGRQSARVAAKLEIRAPGGGTTTFALKAEATAIGRDADNDLVLGDPGVSRRHALLTVAGGRFVVRDEGSSSGTWVNGKRVQEAALYAGDEIRLGSTVIVLRAD